MTWSVVSSWSALGALMINDHKVLATATDVHTMTLEQISSQITEAVKVAAARAGTSVGELSMFRRTDTHYSVGGFQTDCLRTAEWCQKWIRKQNVAHRDFGRPMDPPLLHNEGMFEIRVYEYTID